MSQGRDWLQSKDEIMNNVGNSRESLNTKYVIETNTFKLACSLSYININMRFRLAMTS